jgi:hypothetical protein
MTRIRTPEVERPYVCPGCNAELPADRVASLEHMRQCAVLQDMIDAGRAIHAVRPEKKET